MRISNISNNSLDEEVLDEWSNTDAGIKKELIKKGYKFLGKGVDQSAYLEPGSGLVLKIFGSQKTSKPKFSADQKMFFIWAKFCMKNSTNPFLPKFDGYESFVFNDRLYLQIRQERLRHVADLGYAAESLADFSNSLLPKQCLANFITYRSKDHTLLAKTMDDKQLLLFIKTIKALRAIGYKEGWSWDLHNENIMFRGKLPVIVDPWVVARW